jgi:hypothetical protein
VRRAPQASASDATGSRSLPRVWVKLGLACLAWGVLFASSVPAASAACPNDQFRNGPSAHLPDCRAYELVTPPKLNGLMLSGTGGGSQDNIFTSPSTDASGNTFLFAMFAAGIPGTGSGGYGNLYAASRNESGWTISRRTPSPDQSLAPEPGGYSRGLGYHVIFLEGFRGGSLAFCSACQIVYVRYPDGSFHLLGEGTVSAVPDTDGLENGVIDDPSARPRWITEDGSHQIFQSTVQLTADAPTNETLQLYDRTPAGLKLVSLLPGDVPTSLESLFAGASEDGSTVLFMAGGNLYARVDNTRTVEIASGLLSEVLPGGVTAGGSKVFFVREGNIFYYDLQTEEAVPVVAPGNAILVNVPTDGSHAYFLSESELIPGQGQVGSPNLYYWAAGSVHFIGTLTVGDIARSENPYVGLGLWTKGFNQRPAAENANRGLNTARTTPDGTVIVFESTAQLTPYPNEGFIEIYRYDTISGELTCISCSRANPAATGSSQLVGNLIPSGGFPGASQMIEMLNLSGDGKQVVFESVDALLPQDVNTVRDVYEWRQGELSLISTGRSPQGTTLMGVSPSGGDIFMETGESLVPQGQESGGPAIYDARVNGGLASQQITPSLDCLGEGCQESQGEPGLLLTPGSAMFHGKENLQRKRNTCRQKRARHRSESGRKGSASARRARCRHHHRGKASR